MGAARDVILHLIGVPHVARPTAGAFPTKGYILCAMLLLAGGRPTSRQAAAALLWEEVPEEKALTNLRQLLARINRSWPLDVPLVENRGTSLIAGPATVYSDLAQILAGRRSEILTERAAAVRMVKGELLDTLDTGGPDLSQWFRSERERFRRRALALAGEVLMEMTRFARAPESDIDEIGERMLMLEPEREDSFRVLIEAYGRNGNLEAASRCFQALKDMLRREFAAEPKPEIAGLVRRILASAPGPRLRVVATTAENGADPGGQARLAPAAIRGLAKLPRVALLPPVAISDGQAGTLYRILTDDIANDLSRYRTFAVLAPHSSFYAADGGEARRLTDLRSDYLVSSHVVPGTQRLSLRLARYPEGEILWSSEYRIGLEELPATFRLVSRQIAVTLVGEIERDQLDRMRNDPTPQAYRHFLEGKWLLKNCDLPRLRRARAEFRRSTELDPHFAPARSAIAQALYLEWLMLGGNDPAMLGQARLEADAAIALDPGDGAGYRMSAVISLNQRDFDIVAAKFLEAEALNPHSADLLLSHADALAHLGDADAGWVRFQKALELNPFPPDYYWWSGASVALNRRDFQGAIDLCGKMGSDHSVLRILAISHAWLGNKGVSRRYGERLRDMYPGVTAWDMCNMAPDRRAEDRDFRLQGLRMAGLR